MILKRVFYLSLIFTILIFSIAIYPVIGYPIIGSIHHVGPGNHAHRDGDISELFIAFIVLVGIAIAIWIIRRHKKLTRRRRKQRKSKK